MKTSMLLFASLLLLTLLSFPTLPNQALTPNGYAERGDSVGNGFVEESNPFPTLTVQYAERGDGRGNGLVDSHGAGNGFVEESSPLLTWTIQYAERGDGVGNGLLSGHGAGNG